VEKLIAILLAVVLLWHFASSPSLQEKGIFDEQTYFINSQNIPIVKLETTGATSVEITNLSTDSAIRICRESFFKKKEIAHLEPGGTFTDEVPWDGSLYLYSTYLENGSVTLEPVKVITPISKLTLQRGLFFKWDELAKQRNVPSYVYRIKKGSKVFETYLHGVKITMAFEPQVASELSSFLMEAYFKQAVIDFHRHWLLYQGFPITEYKIIAMDGEKMPPFTETLLGHHVPRSFLLQSIRNSVGHNCEPLSHGIGHAWMGDAISLDVHMMNGWIHEGFDHHNGIITLETRVGYLEDDIRYLRSSKYGKEPLYDLYKKLFGTKYAYTYYAKGSLLAYWISKKLIDEAGKTYAEFMKYLYDKYFLSENNKFSDYLKDDIRISTKELLEDLNEFSGIDFSEMFQKYVYGPEDITEGLIIEERYLPKWDY